ncbi:hypothetical protein GGE45_005380 [Rhizobium aethiopicum]|uniref:YCII-related domain-containing protein n=1 Tax=Rhizobium aethiopicum TaxID=1138170 RepID=A0A7W6QC37_9HYPH|nr:hypothetical protein [Rhizobium aethiopicum]MBB4583016.1 hypothetical protein [Rhizobium aethiopicum]
MQAVATTADIRTTSGLDTCGAVVAHNTSRADLETRIQEDPFVAEGVVSADILEIAPARVDERLAFLKT